MDNNKNLEVELKDVWANPLKRKKHGEKNTRAKKKLANMYNQWWWIQFLSFVCVHYILSDE